MVKNVIFPFLQENTKTIVEAKRLCYEVQTAITQAFQAKIAEAQKNLSGGLTKEIPLVDITEKGAGFKVNKELYNLLAGETLQVTNALLGGMSNAIDSFVQEELNGRSLDTLKTTFL